MKLLFWLAPGLLLAQTEWSVAPEFRGTGYTREKREKGWALVGPGPSGAMTQAFDAAAYRGAAVRLRAEVRVSGAGSAQLLMRVDRPGRLGFFDNMGDRPIRGGEWKTYELTGEVAADARSIEVGVLSSGTAEVVVDSVSFEKLPQSSAEALAAREAIQKNYARADSAYDEGDVDAIASLAMADAEVVIGGARTRLSATLTQIMEQVRRGSRFRSRSTVTAFRLEGSEATAWVNNESTGGASGALSANRDLWVKTAAGWRLKESALIATQPLTPSEVIAEIRQRSGLPEWKEARIILANASEPLQIPGFIPVTADVDPRRAAQTAVAYLREHAPEEAGPAELAFLSNDSSKVAAVTRVFDTHRPNTPEWSLARQSAVIVHQSLTMRDRRDEAIAAHVIWLASEAYRSERIVVAPVPPGAIPFVRARYGTQVYTVGTVDRGLLGGEAFIDIASVPPDSTLGRWLVAQKFPFDGITAR